MSKRTRAAVNYREETPVEEMIEDDAKVSFKDMPLEIKLRIIKWCTPLSALRFSLTCSTLQSACTEQFWYQYAAGQISPLMIIGGRLGVVDYALRHTCNGCEDAAIASIHPIFNLALCEDCTPSDRWRLITVTEAKKEYKVNDKEIANLQFQSKRNPKYKSASPMRLYSLYQIKKISAEKFAQKGTTLEEAKAKPKSPRADPKIKRQANLTAALEEKGLTLRGDSTLCYEYIKTGRGKKSEPFYTSFSLSSQGIQFPNWSKQCYDAILSTSIPSIKRYEIIAITQ